MAAERLLIRSARFGPKRNTTLKGLFPAVLSGSFCLLRLEELSVYYWALSKTEPLLTRGLLPFAP
jgi:hypothetical protein